MNNSNPHTRSYTNPTFNVAVPESRDPFVNTPMISLGPDADGVEQFWISTWNSLSGTTCALIREDCEHKLFRPGLPHSGFYSAAMADPQTIWLCGDLSQIVRMDLLTGGFETFETGASPALNFQGIRYDPATGRLFVSAYPPARRTTTAIIFDTHTCKIVKQIENVCGSHYARLTVPNGDGTYMSIFQTPGHHLMRWDPRADTLTPSQVELPDTLRAMLMYRLIHHPDHGWYLPTLGWYDGVADRMAEDGPRPQQEMLWFARRENSAYGLELERGNATISRWNMDTGEVSRICQLNDTPQDNVQLSAQGKLVSLNLYGQFRRIDPETGSLEASSLLPATARQHVDCLRRINRKRLLGTGFITQRFWEIDLETGQGRDCGRAANGLGEVLETWRLNGRIYMAAYTTGELTEYDPAQPANFPENPRVVAQHPEGMRPVAAADDGRYIWYACTHHYGKLGGTVTRYDTQTGQANYVADPLPNLHVRSIVVTDAGSSLLCGTNINADCYSADPVANAPEAVRLDAQTLAVTGRLPITTGAEMVRVVGPVQGHVHLYLLDSGDVKFVLVDAQSMTLVEDHPLAEVVRDMVNLSRRIEYHRESGQFLCDIEQDVEAWDLTQPAETRRQTIVAGAGGKRWLADADSLMVLDHDHIRVFDDVLKSDPHATV